MLFFLVLAPLTSCDKGNDISTEWKIADLISTDSENVTVKGTPKLMDSPDRSAVFFDGKSDAVYLEEMPLKSLKEFTVEMIFKPHLDGEFEQRIVHIGEVSGDRMLLEIRAVNGQWYFDGYIASGENDKALIDENLTHPLGQWHHVALTVGPDKMSTYVNGELELTSPFIYEPIETGQTSIGVRQNERSWYHGLIHTVKITDKQLVPNQFLTLEK